MFILDNMKENKPSVLDFVLTSILVFILFNLSIGFDRYSFGMMNVQKPVSFGLGVALLCGTNIIFGYLIVRLLQSIYKR
jgi:hypothetical protein